jgi:hypothetical protein
VLPFGHVRDVLRWSLGEGGEAKHGA